MMDKKKADELITGFLEKIYGFAFSKAYSHDEAEELAAEMHITTDNLNNIKRRAMMQLMHVALNDIRNYGKK